MKARHVILSVLALVMVSGAGTAASAGGMCSAKGIPLHGKVKVVKHFGDLKVKVVRSFPDIKVKKVKNFPRRCGEWQFVNSFPDFTIQYVDSFPDITVQYVDNFPGMRR